MLYIVTYNLLTKILDQNQQIHNKINLIPFITLTLKLDNTYLYITICSVNRHSERVQRAWESPSFQFCVRLPQA